MALQVILPEVERLAKFMHDAYCRYMKANVKGWTGFPWKNVRNKWAHRAVAQAVIERFAKEKDNA